MGFRVSKILIMVWISLSVMTPVLAGGPLGVKSQMSGEITEEKEVPEYPTNKITGLLQKVVTQKTKCLKDIKKNKAPAGVCKQMKLLVAMENLLRSYIKVKTRADLAAQKTEYLSQENMNFKNLLKSTREPTSVKESQSCYKPELLKLLMLNEGVAYNGNTLFSKKPVPGGQGVCWTNSKKKKEATISFCEFPLAINIQTSGGPDRYPVRRERDYLFSVNGCDLQAVHIVDKDAKGEYETFLNYDLCLEQWNKRTADAAMTKAQVRLMEDTIGACFREHLLPPRHMVGGRTNPLIRAPSGDSPTPQPRQ
jgi:hypothetical protein